ncbi:hypothetical protein SCP_0508030 [Sparassis crispa]|uniref:Uncharacterized protein n=1 Tax=Sparassis crispa TaxID=139825 RepID=A0A401GNE2_9APHY|nr:hypothetical protein SCP_0508030 [Sparassis crispa]GBE83747.1 hypothetical protein SCP_0508030 [Sparassis crispa]
MALHTSRELRELMVSWRGIKSIQEITALAHCSPRTVNEVFRIHRDYGVVQNPLAHPRGAARILNTGDVNYISSLIAAKPCIYLDELQEELYIHRNIVVSLATLSRTLRRSALSHKQVSKEAMERNELLRATWQAEYGDIPADYFVWLDESSVDDTTSQRMTG